MGSFLHVPVPVPWLDWRYLKQQASLIRATGRLLGTLCLAEALNPNPTPQIILTLWLCSKTETKSAKMLQKERNLQKEGERQRERETDEELLISTASDGPSEC